MLKEIDSTNQGRHARRLLQCLAVAIRPLCVHELAEVLAFDPDVVEGDIPMFRPEWRWEDQEKAVLSACSSLVTIVDGEDCRVVQFSHFSVKEYLTSNRLATASGDVSQYHISPEPAHLILAQACLGVLLKLDGHIDKECYESSDEGTDEYSDERGDEDGGEHCDKDFPLLEYASTHWASHAQVGSVSSGLKNAMDTLFDISQPYFLAWNQKHNVDHNHEHLKSYSIYPANPLYCAALCGFYDLVHRLIAKFPEQVNDRVGVLGFPLVAALCRNNFQVAELLVEHGAHVNARVRALGKYPPLCHAIRFSDDTRVNSVRFLLRHGAYVHAGVQTSRKRGNVGGHQLPLHVAALVGCPEVARILLEHGADVDLPDSRGRIPLHLVSTDDDTGTVSNDNKHEGDRFVLTHLLLKHCRDVNIRDVDDATPLFLASYHGRLEISQLLLDHGANPHAENFQGRNSLHVLSQGIEDKNWLSVNLQNILGVAKLLLEHGVDVNALDKDQATPLHLAAFHGRFEISQMLLDHGAKANAENVLGQTPLHLVSQCPEYCHNENPNIARLLLELGVDVNALDKDHTTPLHFACFHGNIETAHILLDYGAEVNVQNADGQTPLHRFARIFHHRDYDDGSRIVRRLLENGADVNARDKDKATPLHLTSYSGSSKNVQVVQVLLDHGADADVQNTDGRTPLHQVSHNYSHCSQIARLLLDHGGANVNARDKDEETPLHLACSNGNFEAALVLLYHGAELGARNASGQTPLHRGSQVSHVFARTRIVRLLLKRGVDVDARDKNGATPLHLASYKENPPTLRTANIGSRIARVLLDHGAEADAQDLDGQTPLHRVSRSKSHDPGSQGFARVLLEHGVDVNARDRDQETPLHLASYHGGAGVAELLLGHGARVNAEDIRGQTPLHQVLLGSHNYQSLIGRSQKRDPEKAFRLVRRLLESGADVNAQNKDHETPLHMASRLRLYEMARILLKHGADVNVNSEGKSPLQLASGRKGKAMKRLLLANTAKQT